MIGLTKKTISLASLVCLLLVGGLTLYACRNATKRSPDVLAPAPPDIKPHPPIHGDKDQQIQVLKGAESAANAILSDIEENDFESARQHLDTLQAAASNLPGPQLSHPDISPMLGDFFQLYVVQLERSLNTEDKASARFEATVLLGVSRDFLGRLQVGANPELARFVFLTREFAVWTDARDLQMLQIRAAAIRDAWSDLRRTIIQKRNVNAGAEGKRNEEATADFDKISEELQQAGTIEEYAELVQPLREATDHIEELFHQ
jgi:hypothetical protein